MKEQIRGKRLLSILLACIMMISLVPMTAFATGADVMEVSTADGYYNAIRMNSESTARTVKLTNDIDISALDNYAADVYADLTIDLNGHTLTLGGKSVKFWFYKNANVTITDTSDAKTGTISQTGNNHAIDASFYGNAGFGLPDTVKLTVDGITIKGCEGTMANSPRAIFGRDDSNPPALIVKNTKIQDFPVGIQYFSNVQVSNTTVSRTEIGNVQQTSKLCSHDTWTVNDILAEGQKLVVYNTTDGCVHSTPATVTKISDIKALRHFEAQDALEIRVESDGTAPAHTHSWASTWSTDGTHHWHECKATGCDITDNSQKGGYAEHSGGTANCVDKAVCSTCGESYGTTNPDVHRSTSWTAKYDGTHHWTELNCCNAILNAKQAHTYDDDADTTCNGCAYTRAVHTCPTPS